MYIFKRSVWMGLCILTAVMMVLLASNRALTEMVSDSWQKEIPSEAMLLKEAGRVFIVEKKYSEAIEALEKSIIIKPDYYLAIYDLGLAYIMRGFNVNNPSEKDNQRGHELFEQALRIATENNFQDAYIYHIVGWSTLMRLMFSREPNPDVARRYLEIDQMAHKAIQIDPNLGKAYYLLGVLSELKDDFERALMYYVQAGNLGEEEVGADIARMRVRIDK